MLPSSDNFRQKYVKWNFKSSLSTVFFFFFQSSRLFYFDLARGTEEAQVFGRHKTETGGGGEGEKSTKLRQTLEEDPLLLPFPSFPLPFRRLPRSNS